VHKIEIVQRGRKKKEEEKEYNLEKPKTDERKRIVMMKKMTMGFVIYRPNFRLSSL